MSWRVLAWFSVIAVIHGSFSNSDEWIVGGFILMAMAVAAWSKK